MKLSLAKLSHFSAIRWGFGTIRYLLKPRGGEGGRGVWASFTVYSSLIVGYGEGI
jgi:hypothetical protein